MKLEEVILRDDRASQPAAGDVPVGTLYYVTDENVTERSNGSTWDDYSDAVATGAGAPDDAEYVTTATHAGLSAERVVTDTATVTKDTGTAGQLKLNVVPGGIKLDDLGAPDDNTDRDVSTSAHGLTPKAPNDTTKFLRGDAAWAVPVILNTVCSGRLTLESGVAISTSDQTGKTTIYFTPYKGNQVALYTGTIWLYYTLTEISLALGTLTSGKNYDVFLYNNAGTLTLELSAAWTNDTTRADAIALQDGVYVKSGATTRRLVGTIRTTSTTATEDSAAKRFVWNAQHRVRRTMKNATETTDSWTYTTATFRQSNANAANQLMYVVGLAEDPVEANVRAIVGNSGNNVNGVAGVGVDSTSTNSALVFGGNVHVNVAAVTAHYIGVPGIGYHFLAWLEYSQASGTTTWYGDAGAPTVFQSGMYGAVWN